MMVPYITTPVYGCYTITKYCISMENYYSYCTVHSLHHNDVYSDSADGETTTSPKTWWYFSTLHSII